MTDTFACDRKKGGIRRIYDGFMEAVGIMPPSLVASGASPGLQALLAENLSYYRDHQRLGAKMIAVIRYVVSSDHDLKPCARFNAHCLNMLGMDHERIERLAAYPEAAGLAEREERLVAFVVGALRNPAAVSSEHVASLHAAGWSDADIFDALYAAASVIGPGLVMRALGTMESEDPEDREHPPPKGKARERGR